MLAKELIDADADRVVRRLARRGHQAYLVGGCVRDLLLSRTPKDFDVATSATPNEIKHLFRNCRIIGRRFRLAHIFFGGKIIETSTFRANPRHDDDDDELLIRRDNVFGSDTEDARRRDFTVNGLFYDVQTEQVIDHVGGLADLEARLIRTIGDPEIRFREDPVRMLRAIKFAARLDFEIEPATYAALLRHRQDVVKCAPPRVLEELYRMLRSGAAHRSMELMVETGMAGVLSPSLAALLAGPGSIPAPSPPPAEPAEAEPAEAEPAEAEPAEAGDEPPAEVDPAPPTTAETSATPEDPEAAAWAAVWADEAPLPPTPEADAASDAASDAEAEAIPEAEPPPAPKAAPDADTELELALELDRGQDQDQDRDRDQRGTELAALSIEDTPALAEQRAMAWKLIDQLDALPPGETPISNALLLAILLQPFVIDDLLEAGNRPVDASTTILERAQPVVQELRIARRDAERARQILLAQRRLAPSRRRRGRPMALVRRDYFEDSLTLYEMAALAAGRDTADAERWRQLASEGSHESRSGGDEGEHTKKRRRRRGGRRRRRAAGNGSDPAHPDPG